MKFHIYLFVLLVNGLPIYEFVDILINSWKQNHQLQISYDVRFCWYIGQLDVGTALLVGGGSEKSFDADLVFCCESLDVVDGVLQIDDSDWLFIICIITDDSEELGAGVFCMLGSPMLFPPSKFPNTPDLLLDVVDAGVQ